MKFDASATRWTFPSNNVNYGWGVSSAPKGVEGDLGGGLLSHTGEMSSSASEIWTLCHSSLIGTLLIPKSRSQKGVLLSVDTPETCLVWFCFVLLLKMALTQLCVIEQCSSPIVTTDQQRPANHLGSFDLPQLGSSITGCFAVHCTLFTVWSAHCNVAVKGLCEELTVAQGEGLPITES